MEVNRVVTEQHTWSWGGTSVISTRARDFDESQTQRLVVARQLVAFVA